MLPAPVIQLKSVSKRFGEGPLVLEGIDFSARRGDFVSFIGPSGCGKSTLLRLISGLIPLSSGTLEHGGAATAAGEDLAFVFQEPTLLPWLTVAGNVELPLRLRGLPAEERRARREAALTRVRLAGREAAYPRQLSGGQKMRVSIARALALRPQLLLLDEPFGALDEMTRNHLNEELLAIRGDQDWTAFFVTHSVAEAVFLSSRVVVLSANPGRIHAEIQIPLPYPRTDDTRRSAACHELVLRVAGALHSVETPGTPR